MEEDFKKKLENYREDIDDIDKRLVDLLNKSAVIVSKIKKVSTICHCMMQKEKKIS